jgi:GTP:adenosylcobinamide-phosphate guanylyltransferase
MIAVMMCGGRATRLNSDSEKPLLRVGGLPIIHRVAEALEGSHCFDRIIAAVSPNTPGTREFLRLREIEVLETPGIGYSSDLAIVLDRLTPNRAFVISADMPMVSSKMINEIALSQQTKPLLSVMMTRRFVQDIGMVPGFAVSREGREYCYSGISVFDTSRRLGGIIDEEYLVMDKIEIAVNVNTKEELQLAEKLLIQRA